MRENKLFTEVPIATRIPETAKPGDQLVLDPTAEVGLEWGKPLLLLTFRFPGEPVTPRRPVDQ